MGTPELVYGVWMKLEGHQKSLVLSMTEKEFTLELSVLIDGGKTIQEAMVILKQRMIKEVARK